MKDEELQQQLAEWGRAATPDPNATFADNLESGLRAMGVQRAQPRPIWQLLSGVAAAALLVIAGIFALDRYGESDLVVMSASEDTAVFLPSGTELDSPSQLGLPDGSRIEVGPDGSASVGDVVLDAGSVAEIVDGRVEVLRSPTETAPTTAVPTTTQPPTTTAPTTQPPTTTDRTTSTQPERTTTTSTRPTGSISPEIRVELTAALERRDVLLRWTATESDRIAGWEVRSISGDRTATVAVLRDPAARELRVSRPDRTVAYQVFALDRASEVVAESNRAQPR